MVAVPLNPVVALCGGRDGDGCGILPVYTHMHPPAVGRAAPQPAPKPARGPLVPRAFTWPGRALAFSVRSPGEQCARLARGARLAAALAGPPGGAQGRGLGLLHAVQACGPQAQHPFPAPRNSCPATLTPVDAAHVGAENRRVELGVTRASSGGDSK